MMDQQVWEGLRSLFELELELGTRACPTKLTRGDLQVRLQGPAAGDEQGAYVIAGERAYYIYCDHM